MSEELGDNQEAILHLKLASWSVGRVLPPLAWDIYLRQITNRNLKIARLRLSRRRRYGSFHRSPKSQYFPSASTLLFQYSCQHQLLKFIKSVAVEHDKVFSSSIFALARFTLSLLMLMLYLLLSCILQRAFVCRLLSLEPHWTSTV